jgi:hypothetical protein
MQVRVLNEKLESIWTSTNGGGMTFLAHRRDGTLDTIITALEQALLRAQAEQHLSDTDDDVAEQNTKAADEFLQRNGVI